MPVAARAVFATRALSSELYSVHPIVFMTPLCGRLTEATSSTCPELNLSSPYFTLPHPLSSQSVLVMARNQSIIPDTFFHHLSYIFLNCKSHLCLELFWSCIVCGTNSKPLSMFCQSLRPGLTCLSHPISNTCPSMLPFTSSAFFL